MGLPEASVQLDGSPLLTLPNPDALTLRVGPPERTPNDPTHVTLHLITWFLGCNLTRLSVLNLNERTILECSNFPFYRQTHISGESLKYCRVGRTVNLNDDGSN